MLVGLAGCREIDPSFMGGGQLSASGPDATDGTTDAASSSEASTTESPMMPTTSSSSSSPSTTTPDSSTTDDTLGSSESSSSSSGTPTMCGDGKVDAGEDCDDMNADNTDACLDTCVAASCGDGFPWAGMEDCDGSVAGQTCEGMGQPGGGIACSDCMVDATGCACGNSQTAWGVMCPAECTGGCAGTVCTIRCDGNGECEGDAIACPDGWDCAVECTGNSACRTSPIACTGNACTVRCDSGSACRDSVINCGEGTCAVLCEDGNSVCDGLEIVCGANDSSVTCNNADTIVVTPHAGSSCACEAVGC